MPRYYFHIHRPEGTLEDDEGSDLPNIDAVREEAITAVREIVAERVRRGDDADGDELRVADDSGRVVLTVPFREAIISPGC
jgi:predicted N-acetyltransferase YhbS